MVRHEVDFCLRKLEEAHGNYDIVAAKNYTELLKQWLRSSSPKRDNKEGNSS